MIKLFKKKSNISPADLRANREYERGAIIIHHYCPHTFNAGDHFVIRSIRSALKKRIPNAVFVPKPCANNRGWGRPTRLTGPNIQFSNRYADAIVIGGSDQYNGWSLRLKREELDRLVPPLYLIGLGVSSKGIGEDPYVKEKKYYDDILAANQTAVYSSVRDNPTHDFLTGLGADGHTMTGCPAMYLFDEKFALNNSDYALLTFPFPVIKKGNRGAYDALLNTISFLIKHIRKKGLRPVISCHDDRDVQPAQELFPGEELFFSNYVDDYYDMYRNSRIVIGSRLHATILSAGLGKPFININLDMRGSGFSETFGLNDWNLNISMDDLPVNMVRRIDTVLSGDLEVFHNFYAVKERTKAIFEQFMDNVAGDIISKANNMRNSETK